jgi:hypothetical protein
MNYCRTKVQLSVIEAINGTIKATSKRSCCAALAIATRITCF